MYARHLVLVVVRMQAEATNVELLQPTHAGVAARRSALHAVYMFHVAGCS